MGMVKLIMNGHGDVSRNVQNVLQPILDDPTKSPEMVYKIFKDWSSAMKSAG